MSIACFLYLKCDFKSRTRTYKDKYNLHRINNFGAVDSEPLAYRELPEWAKGKGTYDSEDRGNYSE